MDNSAEDLLIARPRLHVFDHFPSTLLDVPAGDLWRVLEGPTLFRIEGRQSQPLFLSVLLHGNEDTGWQAVQSVMREAAARGLPRTLLLFVGNIDAARANVRTLPTQNDYNRTWPGTLLEQTDEAAVMREVVEMVRASNPFASIDIHNNTGDNPFYSCISQHDTATLQLAALFAPITLMYGAVKGVQSIAMARHCPAMTIECGKPGVSDDVGRVVHFLKQLLELPDWTGSQPGRPLDIYRTVVRVNVPDQVSLSFSNPTADLLFPPGLERMNFRPQPAGTVFAHLRPGSKANLLAFDDAGNELGNRYFLHTPDKLVLSQAMIPAMLTHDETVIRQDCLCYLLERIPVSATAG